MLGHGEAYKNNLSGSNSNDGSPQQLLIDNSSPEGPDDDSSMDVDAISDSGLRNSDSGLRNSDSVPRNSDSGLRNSDSEFGIRDGANSTAYKCQMCKELIPLESVTHHVRMHVGKPYKCAVCRMRFWTEDKLENHVRGFHPGRNVEEVCGLQVAAAAEAYSDEVRMNFGFNFKCEMKKNLKYLSLGIKN